MTNRLIITCAFYLTVIGCRSEKQDAHPANSEETPPVAVSIETIKRQPVDQSFDFVGELVAQNSVELASKLTGRIQSIRVKMGDKVKNGDLLVEIENSNLRAQLAEAKASLEIAKASIKRAVVEEKNASNEVARKETLIEKDLVTRQEMDNVRSRKETGAASLDLARAQAAQAKARIQLLQDQLLDARIRSPLSGRVEARYLDPGAVVNPGTAIMRLIAVDPVIARFQVPERYLGEVIRHSAEDENPLVVQAKLDAYEAETFTGKVVRTAPALDKTTRSAFIEAEFPNSEGRLLPGMYCRLKLELGIKTNALLVPLPALLNDNGSGSFENRDPESAMSTEARVYKIVQNRAEQVRVSVGGRQGEYRVALDGIDQGDRVVVAGQSLLKDGSAVKIIKSDGREIAEGAP